VELLVDELPHRGHRALYQPVEIPECTDWSISRPDSHARAEIVASTLKEFDLIGQRSHSHPTYLDIGCSTGFFCNRFQQMGMYAKGIDAVEQNILIAKLLDSFVRRESRPNRKFVTYVATDAYEYLRDTSDERFDVVSAFSVIQWVMTQRPLKDAIECFDWMFAKTKRICVLEMGYSSQDQYGELLPVTVDREWVYDRMSDGRQFDEVRVVDAAAAGVMRDLFIGVKHPGAVA
jgi:SAM-dependent methyltransferase